MKRIVELGEGISEFNNAEPSRIPLFCNPVARYERQQNTVEMANLMGQVTRGGLDLARWLVHLSPLHARGAICAQG